MSAQRDTWHYRAVKFLQRNRTAVGVLALIAAMLTGGVGGMVWQANRAGQLVVERDRAEEGLVEVRRLASSLLQKAPESKDPMVLAERGRAHEQLALLGEDVAANHRRAIEKFTAAIDLQGLGTLDLKLERANAMLGLGQWSEASELFEQASTQFPNRKNALVLLGLGRIDREHGRQRMAAERFREALQIMGNATEGENSAAIGLYRGLARKWLAEVTR